VAWNEMLSVDCHEMFEVKCHTQKRDSAPA